MQEPSERAFRKAGLFARVAPFGLGAIVDRPSSPSATSGRVISIRSCSAQPRRSRSSFWRWLPWERVPSALEIFVPYGCIVLVLAFRVGARGVQIVDRLRATTPLGQTCSAGVVL